MTDQRPVALITMASGYVGPALAVTLAQRGYDLVLQGADGDGSMVGVEVPFADQVPALEALGAAVHTVTDVDLATADGNASLVAQVLDRFGRLDSACLVTGQIIVGKFLDMTVEQWERVKRMNLDMVFHGFLKASRADTDPERRAAIEAQVPMRKLGTMEELASFTSVLLDGSSRFQTGQFFSFSGGWST